MAIITKHFYWLDLIRFFAAFLVIASHLRGGFFVDYASLPLDQQNPLSFCFYSITRIGHEAVLIFFVLSGFLVGGKTIQKIKSRNFDIQSYCIDRSVRIFLPLISALILIWGVNRITGVPNNFIRFFGNLISLQGILVAPVSPPLWSLSYEVWFYVVMGAIALFFSTTSLKKRFISFLVLFITCLVFTKLSITYLFIWGLGAFSYFICSSKIYIPLFSFSLVLCIFLLVLMQMTHSSNFMEIMPLFLSQDTLELLFALVFCFLIQQIVGFIPQSNFVKKINGIGTDLANFSYTLYLTHYPIMELLSFLGFPKSKQINIRSVLYYLIEIFICMIVAYGIYWVFEKRTPDVKQYIKRVVSR